MENTNAIYQNKHKCCCSSYLCPLFAFAQCPIKDTNPTIKDLGENEQAPWPEFTKRIFNQQYKLLH